MTRLNDYFCIANPAAGGGRSAGQLGTVTHQLESAGLSLEVAMTRSAGHATELARKAFSEGYRAFIAVGGDGTAFEVLNGLFPEAHDAAETKLGIVPLGTGNSFLKDFNIHSTDAAIDAIRKGHTTAVDVVRIDHSEGVLHYMNLLGLAFAANVSEVTNRRFKALGPAGYIAGVLHQLVALKDSVIPMRVDEGEWDTTPAQLLSFSNSRFTGGKMMMAPNANVSDGKLDLIRLRHLSRLRLVGAFPRIYAGTHIHMREVDTMLAKTVELMMEAPAPVMIDGEVLRLALKRLTVLPQSLNVFGAP